MPKKQQVLKISSGIFLVVLILTVLASKYCSVAVCTDWNLSLAFSVGIVSLVISFLTLITYRMRASVFQNWLPFSIVYIVIVLYTAPFARLSSGYGLGFGDSPSLRTVAISIMFVLFSFFVILVSLIFGKKD